jgi:hypothetical protein
MSKNEEYQKSNHYWDAISEVITKSYDDILERGK